MGDSPLSLKFSANAENYHSLYSLLFALYSEKGVESLLLEVKNLVKHYKDFLAVDNLNIEIEEGEILGFLGPNGAGKTTTISAITGMSELDSGEIKIFGLDMKTHEKEIKKQIGVVPQDIAVYEDLTAYENLDYFGRLYGLKGAELKDRIHEALKFVDIVDKEKDYSKSFDYNIYFTLHGGSRGTMYENFNN